MLPEAGTLELASTYRNKKIKLLFTKMKNYIAGLAEKVIEITREAENWRDKYYQLKKDHDNLEKDADKVADIWKGYHRVSNLERYSEGKST